jgi:tetratricopeptide (TPR) repeat protein
LTLLAPLEPRPKGTPVPRSLTLDLEIVPQIMTRGGSSILFRQEFLWTVPLPERTAPIRIDNYLPPGHRQRMRFAPGADRSTVEGNIAGARAQQYEVENDFDRSIDWQKRGLALVQPFTNDAQLRRLSLAHTYEEAGDRQHATQWYREVIGISRRHPETWSYYAWQARASLKYMANHKPRRWVGKKQAGGSTLARTPSGRPHAPH